MVKLLGEGKKKEIRLRNNIVFKIPHYQIEQVSVSHASEKIFNQRLLIESFSMSIFEVGVTLLYDCHMIQRFFVFNYTDFLTSI